MTRPTESEVDSALNVATGFDLGTGEDPMVRREYLEVLAAEVRYLRELVSDQATYLRNIRDSHHDIEEKCAGLRRSLDASEFERAMVRDALGRVELLPAKWRAKGFANLVDQLATTESANELERALRGAP